MKIGRDIYFSQGRSCWFFVQVGSTGYFIGTRNGHPLVHLELFTDWHRFRLGFSALNEWKRRRKLAARGMVYKKG